MEELISVINTATNNGDGTLGVAQLEYELKKADIRMHYGPCYCGEKHVRA